MILNDLLGVAVVQILQKKIVLRLKFAVLLAFIFSDPVWC